MPIRVRHEPDIRTMAGLAYGVGQGAKNVRRQERSDRLAIEEARLKAAQATRTDRFNLATRGLETQTAERALARDFEREILGTKADISREVSERNLANQLTLGDAALDRSLVRGETSTEQALERMSFQDELTKGRVIYDYTQQQKREMEKAAEGIAWVQSEQSAGRLTPQQAEGMMDQLNAKLIGVEPVPKYDDTPTGKQRFEQESFVIDEDGTRAVWEANGRLKILEPKSKTDQAIKFADYSKLYSNVFDAMKTTDALGNDVLPDPEEVAARAQAILNSYNRMVTGEDVQAERDAALPPGAPARPEPSIGAQPQRQGPAGYELLAPQAALNTLKNNPQDFAGNEAYFAGVIGQVVNQQNPNLTGKAFDDKVEELFKGIFNRTLPSRSKGKRDLTKLPELSGL